MANVYIYCPRKSTSAFELAKALGGLRLKRFDGMDFWNKGKRFTPEVGSAIVCWGTSLPELEGVRVLNSMDLPLNKWQQWNKLVAARIPSPKMVKGDGHHTAENYRSSGYYPRTNDHTGGLDLLGMDFGAPDFYTYKETITEEIRIHMFNGKSIRAGKKIPRDGFIPSSEASWRPNTNRLHPWVRSYDGGWKISYENFASTPTMRELAKRSIEALGLTFGAVDLAKRSDGTFIVLEVNTSPGLEGHSLEIYCKAIKRWLAQAPPEEVE